MRRINYIIFLLATFLCLPAVASVTYNSPAEKEASQHIRLGIFHAREGDLDKAIAEFEKAVRLYPGAHEAYYNMGLVYMDKGDYKKAAENFERVYEKNPDDIGLNYNYGIALMELERYSEAVPKFEKVLSTNPDDSELKALVEKARRLAGK